MSKRKYKFAHYDLMLKMQKLYKFVRTSLMLKVIIQIIDFLYIFSI